MQAWADHASALARIVAWTQPWLGSSPVTGPDRGLYASLARIIPRPWLGSPPVRKPGPDRRLDAALARIIPRHWPGSPPVRSPGPDHPAARTTEPAFLQHLRSNCPTAVMASPRIPPSPYSTFLLSA